MAWSGTIPIYVNNFNRLASTRALVEWFDDVPGTEVIIVDNKSTYPPLLEWYERECRCKIIRLSSNAGHHAPWNMCAVLWGHTHRGMFGSDWYVVTDPDLCLRDCPKDLLAMCIEGFRVVPGIQKVGISLEIDDIPEVNRARVHQAEHLYWRRPVGTRYFRAPIDTTFAMYPVGLKHVDAMKLNIPTLRTNRPYTARHLPWYLTEGTWPEEDRYYYARCNASTTWKP